MTSTRELYFRLLRYFKPYRGLAVLSVVLMAAAGGVVAIASR